MTEDEAKGYARRLNEASNGKDTMTGHWEMMGIYTTKPFVTFTDHGFPKELIDELEKRTGRKIIGNKAASGTEILDELAEREIENGELIVYTSADSVLQICGNEETMGLETLYHYCEIARELTMKDEWKVGRVIARPYVRERKKESSSAPQTVTTTLSNRREKPCSTRCRRQDMMSSVSEKSTIFSAARASRRV